jgi:hypothetical protein
MTSSLNARLAASVIGLLLPFSILAADDGELWEVTSKMNIPGMPAGMAGMAQAPQRVCNSKNAREDATRRPDTKDCKVTDLKETGPRVQMTMTCPQGKMVIDQTYNAARTEYKSTMKMTSKDGDMVINSTGRKLGTCDVQQAKKARDDKSAKIKSDMDVQIAAGKRQMAQSKQETIDRTKKSCTKAVDEMNFSDLAGPLCYGDRDTLRSAPHCSANADPTAREMINPAESKAFCETKRTEYCKKLQTEAGYARAARANRQGVEGGAGLCGLQRQKLTSTLCASGLKSENYPFLGRFCPAEAKPLFAKHCAGRDYTSLQDKKMRNMCTTLARVDSKDEDGEDRGTASAAPAAKKPTATEQVQQGFGKGLDKLKGLFGR